MKEEEIEHLVKDYLLTARRIDKTPKVKHGSITRKVSAFYSLDDILRILAEYTKTTLGIEVDSTDFNIVMNEHGELDYISAEKIYDFIQSSKM